MNLTANKLVADSQVPLSIALTISVQLIEDSLIQVQSPVGALIYDPHRRLRPGCLVSHLRGIMKHSSD